MGRLYLQYSGFRSFAVFWEPQAWPVRTFFHFWRCQLPNIRWKGVKTSPNLLQKLFQDLLQTLSRSLSRSLANSFKISFKNSCKLFQNLFQDLLQTLATAPHFTLKSPQPLENSLAITPAPQPNVRRFWPAFVLRTCPLFFLHFATAWAARALHFPYCCMTFL